MKIFAPRSFAAAIGRSPRVTVPCGPPEEAQATFAGFIRALERLASAPETVPPSGQPAWPARILQEKP